MAIEIPKLLTEKEAADALRMGCSTLKSKRIKGLIGFIRIDGKNVRYTSEHLNRYIERNQQNREAK